MEEDGDAVFITVNQMFHDMVINSQYRLTVVLLFYGELSL